MRNKGSAQQRVLEFINCDNNFDVRGRGDPEQYTDEDDPEPRDCRGVEELIVWGGCVANCGEDTLSSIVDRNASSLQHVVYCPDRTKGGVLIRPKYHRGDRGGKALFSSLVDLSIRLEPVLLPQQLGWVTPGLKRMRLLCVMRKSPRYTYSALEADGSSKLELPCRRALQQWLNTSEPSGLPQQLLRACPDLESITFSICSTVDSSRTETDWIALLPPKPVPWSIHRLLLLPVLHSRDPQSSALQPANQDGELKCDDATVVSPLSTLTLDLVSCIFKFLGRRHWEYVDREIPEEARERLGLPTPFCSVVAADLRRHFDEHRQIYNDGTGKRDGQVMLT